MESAGFAAPVVATAFDVAAFAVPAGWLAVPPAGWFEPTFERGFVPAFEPVPGGGTDVEVEAPDEPADVPDALAVVPDEPAAVPDAAAGVAVAPSFAISADRLAENPPPFFGAALPLPVAIAIALPAALPVPLPLSFEHAASEQAATEHAASASREVRLQGREVTLQG